MILYNDILLIPKHILYEAHFNPVRDPFFCRNRNVLPWIFSDTTSITIACDYLQTHVFWGTRSRDDKRPVVAVTSFAGKPSCANPVSLGYVKRHRLNWKRVCAAPGATDMTCTFRR